MALKWPKLSRIKKIKPLSFLQLNRGWLELHFGSEIRPRVFIWTPRVLIWVPKYLGFVLGAQNKSFWVPKFLGFGFGRPKWFGCPNLGAQNFGRPNLGAQVGFGRPKSAPINSWWNFELFTFLKFENPSSGSKVSKVELGETGENQGKLNN